jgi:hypothetical protein
VKSYHKDEKRGYGWYSCDECMTRVSEESCFNVGCVWIKDSVMNDGICIPSSSFPSPSTEIRNNLTCEMLLKHQCELYVDVNNTNIINNGPCFFNGYSDDNNNFSDLKFDNCIKKSIIESENCSRIKTNNIIKYRGELRESCKEAHIIFGWRFRCGWVNGYRENTGSCGYIYYLSVNS